MGCDIHMCVEVRQYGNGWEAAILEDGSFDTRHYRLFGWLADVRNPDMIPIKEPRGFPSDLSPEVKNAIDKGMGEHSASWLTVKEIKESYQSLPEDVQEEFAYFMEWLEFKHTVLNYIIEDRPENVRLVFNFDS